MTDVIQLIPDFFIPKSIEKLVQQGIATKNVLQKFATFFVKLRFHTSLENKKDTIALEKMMKDLELELNKLNLNIVKFNEYNFFTSLHYNQENELLDLATKIIKIVEFFGNDHIFFKAYIGCSSYQIDASTPLDLLKNTAIALQEGQNEGEKFFTHYSELTKKENHESEKIKMLTDFRQLIKDKESLFAYQAVVDIQTGNIEYYELLLRLNIENKIVSAGAFISIAEEFRFMHHVDNLTLDLVEESLKKDKFKFSLNLSSITVSNDAWFNRAMQIFSKKEFKDRVTLEITETVMRKNPERTIYFMNKMHEIGCKIALDDFGSGYTFLSDITNLPLDTVKIDGVFIRGIDKSQRNLALVKSIFELCQSRNIKVVAECVETQEEENAVKSIGIRYVQGYLHSIPQCAKPIS